MGIFDFAFKKIILSTFQNDLDKFRTTSLRVQIEAGEKIFADMQAIWINVRSRLKCCPI